MSLPISRIDKSWSLFLDRDGVINRHRPDDYVKSVDEFEFLPGVPEAIAHLAQHFGMLIVVTNQQGVGKGLYSEGELACIHEHMLTELTRSGGRIDRVYFAPQLESENSPMRKPAIGMALQAKQDFPQIEFARSVMVGDTANDMIFGRQAGMFTVWVGAAETAVGNATLVDAAFASLAEFADALDCGRR